MFLNSNDTQQIKLYDCKKHDIPFISYLIFKTARLNYPKPCPDFNVNQNIKNSWSYRQHCTYPFIPGSFLVSLNNSLIIFDVMTNIHGNA